MDCIEQLKRAAFFLLPGTCTILYYLDEIRQLRRITGNRSVILDADSCIVVL